MQLLEGLNKSQHEAVISESDVILCLAGAGTGKTRVLTHRIAHLHHEHRVGTSNMLAMTFTRLAGKEMKERIMDLVGEAEGKKLFCNTFHAFCVQLLKEYGHRIGIDPAFMIYDQSDRDSIIKRIISEYHYDTSLNKVLNEAKEPSGRDNTEKDVLTELNYRLKQNNAVDFDGLLNKTEQLLAEFEDVRLHYKNLYKYVFVDEFQDTSDVQLRIVQLINPDNLFVVGDDFQAIYGWRGAEVRNIVDFPSHFPGCKTIKLTRNYRSTFPIVDASNSLIKYNPNQTDKELNTDVPGALVEFEEYDSEDFEAAGIVQKIKNIGTDSLSDIAILGRTNRQIKNMANHLKENDIPCVVLSNSNDPLRNSVVQSVIGFIELAVNEKDSWKIKRLVNFPENRLRPMQIEEIELNSVMEDQTYLEALEDYKKKEPKLNDFFEVLSKLRTQISDLDAHTAFRATVHTLGLIPTYQRMGLDNRVQDLAIARDTIERWCRIQRSLGESDKSDAFLRYLVTKDIQEKMMEDIDAVKLMTIHGSKGLEFEKVFIVGANEEVFPNLRGDIEEERRLMYVAATRAKDKLFISRPIFVKGYGGNEDMKMRSRFISELGLN
ncbi:UvrD-helicase domain-containing protein [Lentibacillus sp. N15]|uniref:ATP-dependent helicase n=1 Tax=Lentibacillus songyuanensis TaxID=3136161 RepID=UPI0031BA774C